MNPLKTAKRIVSDPDYHWNRSRYFYEQSLLYTANNERDNAVRCIRKGQHHMKCHLTDFAKRINQGTV